MGKQKLDFKSKSMILSILTGVGVAATAVLSAHCAKKDDDTRSLKQRAMIYAPAIVSGVVTVGLVAVNAKTSSEEVAALTIACTGLAANLNDYRNSANEHIESEYELAEIDQTFARNQATRIVENSGNERAKDIATFVDGYTGMSFEASFKKVLKAEKDMMERYENDEPVPWCDLLFLATGSRDAYKSGLGVGNWCPGFCDYGIGWTKAAMEELHGEWYGDRTDVELPPFEIENVPLDDGRYLIQYSFAPEWCYLEY